MNQRRRPLFQGILGSLLLFLFLSGLAAQAAVTESLFFRQAAQRNSAAALARTIDQARQDLAAARSRPTPSPSRTGSVLLTLGRALSAADRDAEAIPIFEELQGLGLKSLRPAGLLGLARSHLKLGQEEKAREYCAELAASFPDFSPVRFAPRMARCFPNTLDGRLGSFLAVGQPPVGNEPLTFSVVKTTGGIARPSSPKPHPLPSPVGDEKSPSPKKPAPPADDPAVLAKAAAKSGDWSAAADLYRQAVTAQPKSYDNRFQLARSLSFSGRREEAVQVYSDLLAENPTNSDVLLGRGRLYAWMKRVNESEADLLAATKRSPGYRDVWSALGDLYKWNGRYQEAAAAFAKCIELEPSDPKGLLERGKVWRSASDFKSARADFEAARTLGWDRREVDKLLATLQARLSNPDASIPEGFRWSAGVSYGRNTFTPDRDPWEEAVLSARGRFSFGSLGFESLHVSRFKKWDDAFALDAYVDLWKRAYGNFRYQRSPDAALYPKTALRGEIYQGFGQGWEFSINRDQLNFPSSTTNMMGAGLGKYLGNWYLRWKTLVTPGSEWTNYSNSFLARNYFSGTADDYVGVSLGSSHGSKYKYRDNVVKAEGSSFGVVYQKFFSPTTGVKISAGFSQEKDGFTERSYGISLTRRW